MGNGKQATHQRKPQKTDIDWDMGSVVSFSTGDDMEDRTIRHCFDLTNSPHDDHHPQWHQGLQYDEEGASLWQRAAFWWFGLAAVAGEGQR